MNEVNKNFKHSAAGQLSLWEQLQSMENLCRAAGRVMANGGCSGIDHQTVKQFEARLEDNLQHLSRELRSGGYRLQPVKQVLIPKPGRSEMRSLGIPTVRDRVVQTALLQVLEPLFEPGFANCSYGFRPGRGCHDALRQVMTLLEAGYVYIVDADISKFFDNLNHQTLLDLIQQKIREEQILHLIRALLKTGVMEGDIVTEPEIGTPQGGPISPLMANICLNPLDHFMVEQGFHMVRYADDFLILSRTPAKATEAHEMVRAWLERTGLSLNLEKTRITDLGNRDSFDFLGYHIDQEGLQPRIENLEKLQGKIWELTRRSRRDKPETIIKDLNDRLGGWIHYFQLTTNPEPFLKLDTWIRKRISNIQGMRQRRKKQYQTDLITQKLVSLHGTWERLRHTRANKIWQQ
jgi:RNA-directed DNA polymerase